MPQITLNPRELTYHSIITHSLNVRSAFVSGCETLTTYQSWSQAPMQWSESAYTVVAFEFGHVCFFYFLSLCNYKKITEKFCTTM